MVSFLIGLNVFLVISHIVIWIATSLINEVRTVVKAIEKFLE